MVDLLQVGLEEGLEKTIEYFRRELERAHHSQRNFYRPHNSNSNSKNNDINIPDWETAALWATTACGAGEWGCQWEIIEERYYGIGIM